LLYFCGHGTLYLLSPEEALFRNRLLSKLELAIPFATGHYTSTGAIDYVMLVNEMHADLKGLYVKAAFCIVVKLQESFFKQRVILF